MALGVITVWLSVIQYIIELAWKKKITTNPNLLRKEDVSMHQKYVDRKVLERKQELNTRAWKEGECKIQWPPRKKGVWGLVVRKVHLSLRQAESAE